MERYELKYLKNKIMRLYVCRVYGCYSSLFLKELKQSRLEKIRVSNAVVCTVGYRGCFTLFKKDYNYYSYENHDSDTLQYM